MLQLIIPAILILLSGCADGLNQVLQFRWINFARKFRKANRNYWNPEISWAAKYKDYNPIMGERFPGSTTIFVFVTDAYHLTRFFVHLFLFSSLSLLIYLRIDFSIWECALVGLAMWIFNRIGFVAVYSKF